ncbi:MAG: WYL domain-containing protein [Treponema sp.]|nr:WYL domain-containing protein [Treponema sp.]
MLYKSFDTLLQKITPKQDEEFLLDRFFVPARPKFLIKPGVSEKVLYALTHNVLLDFYYNSRWEPEERHRRIMPFQIVIDEGALYLYGAKKSPNPNPRLFKLSKMHNVELLSSESFDLPENFRFHEEFEQGRFGAFQYDEWYEFKIEFYGEARAHVRDFVWADDQTIEEKTTLTFTSSQWIPIVHWVLSFGKNAKPIEPDWFVAEIENGKLKDEN